MRKGNLFELERVARDVGAIQCIFPKHGVRGQRRVLLGLELPQIDNPDERGQRTQDRSEFRAAIEGLAAVIVAIDAESELRLQLQEPVDDTAWAKVGAAARPNGAYTDGGQHG